MPIKQHKGKILRTLITIVSKITRDNFDKINDPNITQSIVSNEILEKLDKKSDKCGNNLKRSVFFTILADALIIILKNNPDFTIVFLGTSIKKFDGLMEMIIYVSNHNLFLSSIYIVSLTFYQSIIKKICENKTKGQDNFILFSSYFEAAPAEFMFDAQNFSEFPKIKKLVLINGTTLMLFVMLGIAFHFYALLVGAIDIIQHPLLNAWATWVFISVTALFSILSTLLMTLLAILPLIAER
ncbi:MAG: hypothetical protein CMO05_03700 [Thalassospira sp.]|uniref:hypothetical protein n=1 Tax=Thalassospira sp. GB04J01 TaxID=1485225 RepID=UPI000C0D9EE5|nr:hypothetical protein [Thalassospira sp. GB04J01]MBV16562.1 hypothetical protein [Thalassospira sp.]|tara:strand:+ start:1290 stop:2012 length:723 start_codon:yes stop_codon:yes gene_type:complete